MSCLNLSKLRRKHRYTVVQNMDEGIYSTAVVLNLSQNIAESLSVLLYNNLKNTFVPKHTVPFSIVSCLLHS